MAHYLDGVQHTEILFRGVRLRIDAYKVLLDHTQYAPTIEPAAKGALDKALFQLNLADRLDEISDLVLKRSENG